MNKIALLVMTAAVLLACGKQNSPVTPVPGAFAVSAQSVNGVSSPTGTYYNLNKTPLIRIAFSGGAIDQSTVSGNIYLQNNVGAIVASTYSYPNDSTVTLQPQAMLSTFSGYTVLVQSGVRSTQGVSNRQPLSLTLVTAIDSADKFPRITDSALLTLVEQQTFKYFWDFGHPASGLARERSSSGDVVTTGGSGFGVMAILVGVQRNFISRADALTRLALITNFLSTKVTRYHGAFPHWINGSTGATVPFSQKDDGGDIVETSYMMQGLLCARQFFNSASDSNEVNLRAVINSLWNEVDFNWYRQNSQNALFWNWSPDYSWAVNVQVGGWCEAMITYVLAASSPSNSVPKIVYDNGWAHNGGEKNGNAYYGITLPLGPAFGGPLFFAHYSFLGINPNSLSDAYANYWTQDTAHARINYTYCVKNPKGFNGYSNLCWGLTASDENNGYSAHAPDNDDGVIAPTAAISSLPYTPTESMNALRFFYYTLGDRIWGQYGFFDAFNLSSPWVDRDCLAIDQGPEIVMIENYRSALLWNLFMSCPEIKTGMTNLGFQSPNL